MPHRLKSASLGAGIVLLVQGAAAGCVTGTRVGCVQSSVSSGVAGYDCPLFVDLAHVRDAPADDELHWSFGDRQWVVAAMDPETGPYTVHHS